ncbi:MAG: hypothetical protein AB8B87_12210 [Granulosicoccus sp.]
MKNRDGVVGKNHQRYSDDDFMPLTIAPTINFQRDVVDRNLAAIEFQERDSMSRPARTAA